MQVKRIGLVTSNLGQGGVGRNMLNLASELADKGIETDLFLVNHETGGRLSEVPSRVNIFEGAGRARNSLIKLVEYLHLREPDAVISGPSRINPLCISAKLIARKRVPVIATYRSDRVLELQHMGIKGKLEEYLGGHLYRFADALVGVSQGVTQSLLETLPGVPEIVTTIYNPAYRNSSPHQSRDGYPHPWLGQREFSTLVTAGRLEKQKDLPTLLQAMEILNRQKDVRLIVLGDGSLREQLVKEAETLGVLGRISWVGYVDNPRRYFSFSDGFVLSSIWEGFGNVIVEALGEGVPIVSTDCPSGPSEILAGGAYGRLVRPQQPAELARAIDEMIGEQPDRATLRARAREFSVEAAAANYLSLIDALARTKGRASKDW